MRARKMLTSPALLSMVSSKSASTRAISTRSAGALSRPGNTGALLSSRLVAESSLTATETGSGGAAGRCAAAAGAAATNTEMPVGTAFSDTAFSDTALSGGAVIGGAAFGDAAVEAGAGTAAGPGGATGAAG